MSRTNRIAIFAAMALLVAMAGTALATRTPTAETPAPQLADEHEEGGPEDEAPDDVVVDRVATRLGVEADRVRELANEHGFGTAVRLLAWEQASAGEVTVEQLLQRRADGEGWGEIAKDLEEFGLHPGIGSVMGNGGGHGRDGAPGQQRDGDEDD